MKFIQPYLSLLRNMKPFTRLVSLSHRILQHTVLSHDGNGKRMMTTMISAGMASAPIRNLINSPSREDDRKRILVQSEPSFYNDPNAMETS